MHNKDKSMNNVSHGFRRFTSRLALWLGLVLSLLCVSQAQAVQTKTYYHLDALGSTVAATDESGAVIWRDHYRPYGDRLNKNNLVNQTNTRWFAGHAEDKETGLSYMGARYYDPIVGRFMGIDPVTFKESNIHSFNRYAYGNNNPYRYIDRNGEWAEDLVLGVPSLVLGAASFAENLGNGNWGWAAVDAVGMAIDVAAIATPGVPGGTGMAIQAGRAGAKGVTKNTTVLGENMMQRVIPYAEKTGAQYIPFGTTKQEWAKLSPKQRWKLNDGALRKRIKEGDDFVYIGRDPGKSQAERNKFDLTGSELLRLRERGVNYKTVDP